jgi:hypothetical protein
MISVETTVEIDCPSGEVFAFVADQTNAPRWQRGLNEVRRTTEGPLGVGTEHLFIRRFAGRRLKSRNRYTGYEDGRYVEFEIPEGWVSGHASYLVEPLGAGTSRLISRVSLRASGPVRLVAPLLGRLLARDSARDEAQLKALMEAGGAR